MHPPSRYAESQIKQNKDFKKASADINIIRYIKRLNINNSVEINTTLKKNIYIIYN